MIRAEYKNCYYLTLVFCLVSISAMGQHSKASIGIRYGYQYNFHIAAGSSDSFLFYDYDEILLKPASSLALHSEYIFDHKNALRFGMGVSIREFDITNAIDPFFSFILPYYQTRKYNATLFVEYKRYLKATKKIHPYLHGGLYSETPFKIVTKRVIVNEPSDNYENVSFEAFSEFILGTRAGVGYTHFIGKKFSYELNAVVSYELVNSFSEFDTTQPFSVGIQLVLNYHFRKKR
jgi:hypothetical protein